MTTKLDNLERLVQAERKYLDILNIIDSKLSPLWMKQMESIAPDFSELLKCIQDVTAANKEFYENILKKNSQSNLDDLLMQWIREMKLPYRKYSNNFINNINQRQDILCITSIQQLLNDINSNVNQEEQVTLETLFYAPLQQLDIYKSLFNNFNSISRNTLDQANQLLDSLMIKNSLPAIKLDSFHSQVNCTNVVNILNDKPNPNYQLDPLSKVLLYHSFDCLELSKRIKLILTINQLIFCSQNDKELLYEPIPTQHISIRTIHTDRELIGEYHFQLWVHKQKLFTMKTITREERNMWLGVDINSSSRGHSASWKPINDVVEKYDIRRQSSDATVTRSRTTVSEKPSIRTEDIFSFYNDQSGEVSPLVSSSDESEEDEHDNASWEEEKKETASADYKDKKGQSLDKGFLASSSANYNNNFAIQQEKSLPPPPPVPKKTPMTSLIISGTKSLPTRKQSLKQFSDPSDTTIPDAISSERPLPARPGNVRSVSAHQSLTLSQQQQTVQGQKDSLPPNHPYQQHQQQIPSSTISKKPSFMQSVMNAVSSPRSSFRQSKLDLKKPSMDSIAVETTVENTLPASIPNASAVSPSSQKFEIHNMSAVSLDHHTVQANNLFSSRRYSAIPSQNSHVPLPPQSLRPSVINQSTASFTSNANSISQTSLASTPPLSRSSSPGSVTPNMLSRYQTPSSSSFEYLGSPPKSPEILNNGSTIKQVLCSYDQVEVFRWKDNSWYAVEENCLLEVRQTFSNRSCVAIRMKSSGKLYLNAWILPDTFICRTAETDLSLSLHIGNNQSAMENYLLHCKSKQEADNLSEILERMHQESIKMNMVISATSTLRGAPPVLMRNISLANSIAPATALSPEDLQKTLKLAMQCKCKLFVQSASSKWNSFGSVYMKVSQQYATKKMHIAMESHKGGKTTQLVAAMIQSRNVERLGSKRISFLLVDELEKNSVVYMVQVREELTGDKIFEYIKTKNAENGW